MLKRGQTVRLVTSCVVMQEEQGQTPAEHSDAMQSVTGTCNDKGTHIGSTSVGDAEKGCWKAQSVQSVESRKSQETEEEKLQFIPERVQLDTSKILNADAKLKVIKLFLDNFEVLATHPSQYGETEVLEMKIDLVPGEIPSKSKLRSLNPDQKDNLQRMDGRDRSQI